MLLSIIVPHKNDIDRLEKLIMSIPQRKYFEIIVVDDHSDNIENIIKRLEKFSMVNLYINNSNTLSAGKARNIGLEKAKGKWIIFADSDDYFLEEFLYAFSKYKNSDFDVIYFQPEFPKNHSVTHISNIFDLYFQNPTEENKMRVKLNNTAPWSKMMRLDYIKAKSIIFEETIKSNDQMFSLKQAIFTKQTEIASERIYHFEVHNGGITKNKTKEAFIDSVGVFSRSYNLLSNNLSSNEMGNLFPEMYYFPFKFLVESLINYNSYTLFKIVKAEYKKNANWKISVNTFLLAIKAFYKNNKLHKKISRGAHEKK